MDEIERIRVNDITVKLGDPKETIIEKVVNQLKIEAADIVSWQIRKESIDARKKDQVKLVYTVDLVLKPGTSEKCAAQKIKTQAPPDETYRLPTEGAEQSTGRPVVVGFGPCGLFAALILAEAGYRPIVIERGQAIEKRGEDVEQFWQTGKLLPQSHVLFGEGGAGAFSDGKLTTRIKDIRIVKVLDTLVKAGAPEDIRYKQKPHIGTDLLKGVVREIREQIIRLGGEIRFGCRLVGIEKDTDGCLRAIRTADGGLIETNALVLALGHSARDTIRSLHQCGLAMEQKPFSMGVRIEHLQDKIDRTQLGSAAGHPALGAAEYALSYRCANGRGVYTFCMCPGGHVIASASEEGGLVTNGMSFHDRGGANANSALLVDVRTEDFGDNHPLAGFAFQRKWEEKAYELGGGAYIAPIQRLGDFMGWEGRPSQQKVEPTYRPGIRRAEIDRCLPAFVTEALREAIPELGKKLRGFDDPGAVMTAIESRSSSPVRINRGADMQSNIGGIYPAGEGAGYAGGITSAAVDGIKAAEQIITMFAPSAPMV